MRTPASDERPQPNAVASCSPRPAPAQSGSTAAGDTVPALDGVHFVVTRIPLADEPAPRIGVDGPVIGADHLYDHHASGESVNLLAIPSDPPYPGTLATTMLDGDAVISAAVVLLRACREHATIERHWQTLHEAAHWCDWLVPSGRFPSAERAGLGLHCWLKERGFGLRECLALSAGDFSVRNGDALVPSATAAATGEAFRLLTLALVHTLRAGVLPSDTTYLARLDAMAARARACIVARDGQLTTLEPDGYIDPLALYQATETDLCLMITRIDAEHTVYKLGVHPKAYARVDLRPVWERLANLEPGWGGRANAGGSPQGKGSALSVATVVETVEAALGGVGSRPGRAS